MNKYNDFSIVFLPEFLIPTLEEIKINMVDFNDIIKNYEVKRNLDVKADEEYKSTVDKLRKFIGNGDLTEMAVLNKYLHEVLQIELYQNNFRTFFEEILQGSGSYKNEENTNGLILKSLLSNNVTEFKDTYNIINNNNVITVVLKEGFSNYLIGSKVTKFRYTLLKEIIDSVNSEAITCNSIGVSFAIISGVMKYTDNNA